MTTGEGELAGTEAEAEGVPAGDAELVVVPVAGFGVVVGLARAVGPEVVADGDVVGTGASKVAGVTTTVAAGGGLKSR